MHMPQALIDQKEARLKRMRAAAPSPTGSLDSPTNRSASPAAAAAGARPVSSIESKYGIGSATPASPRYSPPAAAAASASPPPLAPRRSFSLIKVAVVPPNTAPLGKLQPSGRRVYRACASGRFGPRSHFVKDAARGGLFCSGLPTELVERWHAGCISGDLALREVLDAVCRATKTSAAPEEREFCSMTGAYSADGGLALGGLLGGLVGGLPSPLLPPGSSHSSADVAPLRAQLARDPDAVCCDALRMFTRQLLTEAEAEREVPGGAGLDRHALTIDLAKLSSEELNLAFRRECLKHHPSRPDGSLGGLLAVHLHFELVALTYAPLSRSMAPRGRGAKEPAEKREPPAPPPLDDGEVLRETGRSDLELAAEGQAMADDELERLNERGSARALYLSRVRDLLDGQLEAMQAVGSYSIIGCAPGASDKELAAAYRDAARRLHPDRGGDVASFQKLQVRPRHPP